MFNREQWVRVIESDNDGEEQFEAQEVASIVESVGQASAPKGTMWSVTILEFGKSKRAPHFTYLRENIEKNLSKFDGAKVYANRESDDYGHKRRNKKVPRDIVGMITDPKTTDTALVGTFNLLPASTWLRDNLLFAESKGKLNLYELSIDATGIAKPGDYKGERLPIVQEFGHVDVDVVPSGAAGGGFNHLIESLQTSINKGATKMKHKLLALFTLLYPAFLESKNVDYLKVDENELGTYLLEADKAQGQIKLPDGMQLKDASKLTEEVVDANLTRLRESLKPGGSDPAKEIKESKQDPKPSEPALPPGYAEMQESMKKMELQNCQFMVEREIRASNLPEPLQDNLKKQFRSRLVTEAEIKEAIKDTRAIWAKMAPKNPTSLIIEGGVDEIDKLKLGLTGLFYRGSNHRITPEEMKESLGGIPPMRSIKEAYQLITGDTGITGMRKDATRLTESLITSDWAQVTQDAMHKALVREYGLLNLDTWRPFVSVTSVNDFKTQHRIRWGGYANLASVAERGPYLPMTSPTDEEATYVPSKYGGTEDLTLEMIKNDDTSAVSRIPQKMARAAAQTLHEFVYDFLRPGVNPTIYDGVALYHANHSNIGSDAVLSSTTLAAARLRMKKQANLDNAKRLGLRTRILLIPSDLEETAYGLLTPAYAKNNAVPDFVQQVGMAYIVVDYWTDANDYAFVCDPSDLVGLEIGFMDGQEQPQLFVSDMPNTGSMFTNDVITYKIKHTYGGAIIDYRAFDGTIKS